jgi:hypothetical protein
MPQEFEWLFPTPAQQTSPDHTNLVKRERKEEKITTKQTDKVSKKNK